MFAIAFSFYKILLLPDTKEIKKQLKIAGTRLAGALIPVLIFIIYLNLFGIWKDFLDYAIFGIKTFSNSCPFYLLFLNDKFIVKALAGMYIIQMGIMTGIYILSFKRKDIQGKEWFKNTGILLMYSAMASVVMIPIADKIHFAIGASISNIAFIYYLYNIAKEIKNEKIKKIAKIYVDILAKILFFIAICYSIALIIANFKSEDLRTDLNHFKFNRMDKEIYERVVEINEFIIEQEKAGKKVHELDMLSAICSISLDKYYKDYDMFNLGNFGTKGEKGIIEDLKQKENIVILLKQYKYKTNWQYPKEVADYIRENFKKMRRNRYIRDI